MLYEYAAHAKINWALNVTGRRGDGYHLLDMVMQSVDLHDTLQVRSDEGLSLSVDGAPAGEGISLTVNGVVPEDAEKNLVVRAAKALNAHCGTAHGARIALEKRIPARAGLGGGSADCALTLRVLNEMWGLGLPDGTRSDIGARLGADVPFCLTGGLARVTGSGENIAPCPASPRVPLVPGPPGGGLSTAEVFALWDSGNFPPVALDTPALAEAVQRRDLSAVQRLCKNALTAPAIRLMPEIGELLRAFDAPAVFMTGSGSTVVAAFEDEARAREAFEKIPGALLTHTR